MEFHIEAEILNKALCQSTYFKVIDGNDVIIPFFDIQHLEGYNEPQNFPNCCSFHKSAFENGITVFEKFPNCCEPHKELAKKKLFRKENYETLPIKVVKQLSYTEHCIAININTPDWYDAIIEYIDWNIESFGHPLVGSNHYVHCLKHALTFHRDNLKIDDKKAEKIITYLIELEKNEPEKNEPVDINKLYELYEKWLKLFPFQLSFFSSLKSYYLQHLPFISGNIIENRYSKTVKSKLISIDELIDNLGKTTKTILNLIDTSKLVGDGLLNDVEAISYNLIIETHRVKQLTLLGDYNQNEQQYTSLISDWLTEEKIFFQNIAPFVLKITPPQQSKSEQLSKELAEYGFFELEKVKAKTNWAALLTLISTNGLPYQVAMLRYLGFIDSIEKNFCKSKEDMYKKLSKILSTSARAVRGNILVFNVKSEEDRVKYTSHMHTQKVEKDYKAIN